MTALTLFSPAGVVAQPPRLRLAAQRLRALGFEVSVDEAARARAQRFAGADEVRLAALHRVADAAPAVAMAVRGGYGLTRLLDAIAWKRIGRSISRGTRWVGFSDVTALQTGLLAHLGAVDAACTWAGPMALDHFTRADEDGGVDEVTAGCFVEAMSGELEAVGFRTEAGHDGLERKGLLWGGNLAMLCSLLGTPHFPAPKVVKGGILFLEDVGEHPYRIERMLLQLQQAGVIDAQRAVLLGQFTGWKPGALDRGYTLKTAFEALRARTKTPLITGLPMGHVPTIVSLPVGRRVNLVVSGRDAFLAWPHAH